MDMHRLRLRVIDQIKDDVKYDCLEELYKLLKYIPSHALKPYLTEMENSNE